MTMNRDMELYIHVPFCVRKCAYCDFLSFSREPEVRSAYVKRLTEDIAAFGERFRDKEITSLFVGGGTPSILSPRELEKIIGRTFECFSFSKDSEITVEANPGTLNADKLSALFSAGANRLSLGLQSADEKELKMLGRIHSYESFLEEYALSRKVGFSNINVDLISALPGQSPDSFAETLHKVLALSPEHLSVYSLITEEGTPFAGGLDALGRPLPPYPTEEEVEEMDEITESLLPSCGYNRYEISNYGLPGRECRHNIGYWTGVSYLGIGLGAASYFDRGRYKVTESLGDYLKGEGEPELTEVIGVKEAMEEFMILGLRMIRGVSASEFKKRFQCDIETVYGEVIERLTTGGLLLRDSDRIALSPRGLRLANPVMAEFLTD